MFLFFICVILIFSVCLTHHALINKDSNERKKGLLITITPGIYFCFLQLIECINFLFTIADSIYGSIFFNATGFHEIHIIIGALYLSVCLIRFYNVLSSYQYFGFEAAS
ncbi:COX3 oxidase, partial [Acromyrmex insinuator]